MRFVWPVGDVRWAPTALAACGQRTLLIAVLNRGALPGSRKDMLPPCEACVVLGERRV